mgnify:FL=1
MNITSAKYCPKTKFESESSYINATIDGKENIVPIDTNNREYLAILEWVSDGNIIESAD